MPWHDKKWRQPNKKWTQDQGNEFELSLIFVCLDIVLKSWSHFLCLEQFLLNEIKRGMILSPCLDGSKYQIVKSGFVIYF
jgi:hypothetical protein